MPIHVQCRKCGREYDIKEKFAGRTLPCKECGAKFRVPAEAADEFVDYDDDFDDMFGGDSSGSSRRRRSSSSPSRSSASSGSSAKRKRSRSADEAPPPPSRSGSRRSKSPSKSRRSKAAPPPEDFLDSDKFRYVAVGVIAVMIILAGIWWAITVASMKSGGGGGNSCIGSGNAGGLFSVASVPLPSFPQLPPNGRPLPSGVRVYDVRSNQTNTPGGAMQFRVYLPPGQHAPGSLGCVLVAPAGSNLLCGNSLDDSNYHDETEPYAKAGFAVVSYSIDGGIEDLDFAEDLEIAEAYTEFKDAHAGVVNARNALEFVLARLPQVNPQAIYSAGHSSAGTLSLLFAEHEPRLAGSIAYAPATDVVARLGEVTLDPYTVSLLPGIADFIVQSSPRTHVGSLSCPVFLFHARDDSNEPFGTTEQFANQASSLGKDVTLRLVASGDHYDSMIREGIPAGIQWLKQKMVVPATPSNQTPKTNTARPAHSEPSQPVVHSEPQPQPMPTAPQSTPTTSNSLPVRDMGPPIPPGMAVMAFEVKGYQGAEEPYRVIQRVLFREPWVRRPFIRWEASQSRVLVATRGGLAATTDAETKLKAAGFELGTVELTEGSLP